MRKWSNFDLRIEGTPPPRTRKTNKTPSVGGESRASKSSSSSAGDRPKTSELRGQSATTQSTHRSSSNTSASSSSTVNKIAVPIVMSERDSRASIRDDPFFRPYQSAQSARMAEKVRNSSIQTFEDVSKPSHIRTIHLAVLGAQGVGKSRFIQRALDLRQLPSTRASAKKMSLDLVIYLVKLIEISLDDIVISSRGRITWPSTIDERPIPPIDGIMILYDVTNRASVSNFKALLGGLSASGKPCVIVSCKCDNPPRTRQIEPGLVEELGKSCGGLETYQTSANVPESQKRCISVLLRQIIGDAESPKPTQSPSSRSHAGSISDTPPADTSPTRSRHPVPKGKAKAGEDRSSPLEASSKASKVQGTRRSSHVGSKSRHLDFGNPSSSESQRSANKRDSQQPPASPTSYLLDSALRPSSADTADSQPYNTFLDMDDDDQSEFMPDNMSISQQSTTDMASLRITEKDQTESGSPFDELVDRLLALPMSKAEGKFVPVFLCLYRKFAAPNLLLTAILAKFEKVDKSGEAQLTRVGEQLRYLQVLAQWTNEYPGDFSYPTTRNEIMAFVTRLEKSRVFTYAAKEINNYLEHVATDDDTGWAFHDGAEDDATIESAVSASSTTLVSNTSKASLHDSLKDTPADSKEDLGDASSRASMAPSSLGSALGASFSNSSQSLATLMTYEEASREAQLLIPHPRRKLDKTIWRQFMALPGEDIAREMTRIDWIMYSSIRPRDLIRHVSLTGEKKEKSRSLENVNRMISHFNHIALFVSSMILLRDKPKHRALALEKFMHIAWKLRQLNNYNSLGSVIAGINGTAIHRLALTRELVPPPVQKEFMRLVILMGTGKSHFAYRLAWDNSFSEKIPFLPLHRRDLVAAEDGNKTFVGPNGDRINWKKFDIMGDVIIEIQKSQEKPYPSMVRNDEILRLILETKFLDGDEDAIDPYQELYERSVQLEPTGAADAKKGFGWLRGR